MSAITAWKQRNEWWPILALLLAIGLADPFVEWVVMGVLV